MPQSTSPDPQPGCDGSNAAGRRRRGPLAALLARLAGDRRGNVALIFALSLIPLMLLVGVGLDYRRNITSTDYVKDAADAAVLAAAKNYFQNSALAADARLAAAAAVANTVMTNQLAGRGGVVLKPSWTLTVNTTTNQLELVATGFSPTAFGSFVGLNTWPFSVDTRAAAGGKPVEIALMLDNTASMFEIGAGGAAVRFTTMRQSAESYVNQVFDLGGDRVKISVIPWATLVNINAEAVAATDTSSYTVANVPPQGSGRTPLPSAVDHTSVLALPTNPATALSAANLTLLSKPTTWRGCVRSATGEVTVDANGNVTQAITDTPPTGKWPAALIPATVKITNNPAKTTQPVTTICDVYTPTTKTTTTTVCDVYTTVTTPDPPGPQGALDHRRSRFGSPEIAQAADHHPSRKQGWPLGMTRQQAEWASLFTPAATTKVCTQSHTVTTTSTTNVCTQSHTQPNGPPVTTPQSCTIADTYTDDSRYNAYLPDASACTGVTPAVNACQSDPNDITYINGGHTFCSWRPDAFTAGGARNWNAETQAISGPNVNCPAPILPLSTNRAQVLNKLNEMYPVPTGTLTDVGLLWGLRTLSPNSYWTSFWGLSGSQVPAAFNDGKTSKIAIILSDGANEAPFWMEGYYGCTAAASSPASTPAVSRTNSADCWRSPNISAMPRTQAADNTAANNMMLSACNQMRTVYGVDLYYILVDVTDPTATAIASQCAPDPGHAISTTSGNLQSVFNTLVSHSLRLTH